MTQQEQPAGESLDERLAMIIDEFKAIRDGKAKYEELKGLAALADEIRPLAEILAARIGKLPFAAEGEAWETFTAWVKVARGNNEMPAWLARFDAAKAQS